MLHIIKHAFTESRKAETDKKKDMEQWKNMADDSFSASAASLIDRLEIHNPILATKNI